MQGHVKVDGAELTQETQKEHNMTLRMVQAASTFEFAVSAEPSKNGEPKYERILDI